MSQLALMPLMWHCEFRCLESAHVGHANSYALDVVLVRQSHACVCQLATDRLRI